MTARIDALNAKLDALSKAISDAYNELGEAEKAWLPMFDAVAETLREEAREQGRKSDPAEHTVLSAARLRYPAEYTRWRDAKREVAKLETIAQNRRSELSGEQTKAREQGAQGSQATPDDLRRVREQARGRAA